MATTTVTQTSYRRYNPRPSCTHIHMDRIYGTHLQCSICGRVPSVNFIYTCQVDADPAFSGLQPPVNSALLSTRDRSKSPPVSRQNKRRKLQKTFIRDPSPVSTISPVRQLHDLGFNKSVIKAAEEGHYTVDQLNLIVKQKQDVRNTIDSIVGDKNRSRSQTKAMEPCDFRVCHTCRPLSRDRSFASVELIMNDEIQLPSVEMPQLMPVNSVQHMKALGTKASPLPQDPLHCPATPDPETLESDLESEETSSASTSSSDFDLSNRKLKSVRKDSGRGNIPHSLAEQMNQLSLDVDGHPDRPQATKPTNDHRMLSKELGKHGARLAQAASNNGFYDCLVKDLQQMLVRAHSSAAESPNGCDVWTGLTKDILDKILALYAKKHGQVFDATLYEAMSLALVAEASQKPLPSETADEMERVYLRRGISPRKGPLGLSKPRSFQSLLQDYSPVRTPVAQRLHFREGTFDDREPIGGLNLEEEVEGGIAVTEEAVVNHAPDIIKAV